MNTLQRSIRHGGILLTWGPVWLFIATFLAGLYFLDGLEALTNAWALPEYSHGPLIPILSGLLFLRQLKEYPPEPGPKHDRWIGVAVIFAAFAMGTLGKLASISDIVAYAMILWVGGILLVSFGWQTGKHFWPPVLHLVYMLPLPGVLYFKLNTWLQLISSELGVFFLQLANVPVFLEGNIIDLGVLRLHVAEACSGLRYLFPILSFSYIFAVLYRGPMWHKAMLLISAAPITVFMNSVRIAVAGIIAQHYGTEWLDGFTHFFEGWVIFASCVAILFLLAWLLLFLQPKKMGLTEALDLETDGLMTQAARIRLTQPSAAMLTATALSVAAIGAFEALPKRDTQEIHRESFVFFPRTLGTWEQEGPRQRLEDVVVQVLGADDHHSINLSRSAEEPNVGLFMAWYRDQSQGGVHSPEVCLPGSGWEIAWLERVNIAPELDETTGPQASFDINRAIIQRGETRMMVYYWFQQGDRRVAWDVAAKFYLLVDGIRTGSTNGALVRLTTVIEPVQNGEAAAAERLNDLLENLAPVLPRFIPEQPLGQ
jgi:exosortase D (VPLPA-CTERM-specific)